MRVVESFDEALSPETRRPIDYRLVALVLVIVIAVIVYFAPDSPPGPIDAFVYCEEFALERLTAPATAVFGEYSDASVTSTEESSFHVLTHVDSENGFGAMLRSSVDCTLTPVPDGWRLLSIDIRGR